MKKYFITQNFPVANHVYKFLKSTYGTDHINLDKNYYINLIILDLHQREVISQNIKVTSYTKIFKVDISETYFTRRGMHLHPNHAVNFNKIIDGIFRDEIYKNALIRSYKDDKLVLQCLRDHLEIYDITEEDLKLESLYRDFKRKKEKYERIIKNKKGTKETFV